jgi:hypothetical protein
MGTITQRALLGVLAGAEVHHAGGFGLVGDRREGAALVGAVAERLGFAVSAGAPVIGLTGFDEDGERGFLRDVRGGHELKVQGLRSSDYGVLMKKSNNQGLSSR